jgi:uncharacterized delta-60 repeat protein
MCGTARVRKLLRAASAEVDRILGSIRLSRERAQSAYRRFQWDDLEPRVMLSLPSVSPIADRTTSEGYVMTLTGVTFSDDNAVADSICVDWGDGTQSGASFSPSAGPPTSPPTYDVTGASHVYRENGNYTATLRVIDSAEGGAGCRTFTVSVANTAPTLTFGGNPTIAEGNNTYTLILTKSDPGTDTIQSWHIEWGDGQVSNPAGTATSATHVFTTGVGRPRITATATDEDGTYAARFFELDRSLSFTGRRIDSGGATVRGIAVQSDGKIVLARDNGTQIGLMRILPTGSIDTTFGKLVGGTRTGFTDWIDYAGTAAYAGDVVIQHVNGEDAILLAGSRSGAGGNNDFALVRFHANGDLDTGFGTSGDGRVSLDFNGGYDFAYGIALQGEKIVLAGSAAHAPGSTNYDTAVARFNPNGTLDDTFGDAVPGGGVRTGKTTFEFVPNFADNAYDVAITPVTNTIVLAGTTQTGGSTGGDFAVARMRPDGDGLDYTFGAFESGSTTVRTGKTTIDIRVTGDTARGVTIQADGKIVVAGSTASVSGTFNDFAVARLNADGSLDDGSVTLDADGPDSDPLDRWGTDGRVVTNFADGSNDASSLVMQIDGRLVVVGYSVTPLGTTDFAVSRYMPDGSLDNSFGVGGKLVTDLGFEDQAYAVALQADGKLLVGGKASTNSVVARYQSVNAMEVIVVPRAPTALSVAATTDAAVQLSWTDNSSVEGGFVIQRFVNGVWSDIGTVPANTTTYRDAGLSATTQYKYRVWSYNSAYRSTAASNEATTTTQLQANPDFANVGQVVHLRAPAGGSQSAVYTWNVSKEGEPHASGSGATFDFTPDAAGTYYVTTYTQDGGTTTFSTQTIVVKEAAPQGVKITGAGVVPFDRAGVFGVSVANANAGGGGLHYAWAVEVWKQDAQGNYDWREVTRPPDTATDLASFRFVPGLDDAGAAEVPANYRVSVTVTNDQGQSATTTREFKAVLTTQDLLNADANFGGQAEPFAIAVQPADGKVVLAGYFKRTDESGTHCGFALARFLVAADADDPTQTLQLDPSFGGGDGMVTTEFSSASIHWDPLSAAAFALTVTDEGRIIAVGEVPTGTSVHSALAIVAYDSAGNLDTTFGPIQSGTTHTGIVVDDFGGEVGARAVAVQGDGRIIVAGWYGDRVEQFVKRVFVARYNADGSPDNGVSGSDATPADRFGLAGGGGRVIVQVGAFDNTQEDPSNSTMPQVPATISALTIQPYDQKIVAVGWANLTGDTYPTGSGSDFLVMRLNADGTPDDQFGAEGGDGIVLTDLDHASPAPPPAQSLKQDGATSVVIQPDHKILVGGWTGRMGNNHSSQTDFAMVRYDVDGTFDEGFGFPAGENVRTGKYIDDVTGTTGTVGINERIVGMALQPEDGKIIVAGGFRMEAEAGFLARYESNGSPDEHFDYHQNSALQDVEGHYTNQLFEDHANAIALGADGIYVASALTGGFSLTRYMTRDSAALHLTASARAEGMIDLRWADLGGGEDGFGIERWDPAAQAFMDLAYVGRDVTRYTDTDVRPGVTYRYRVYAFVGQNQGGSPVLARKGVSNEASASTAFPNGAQYKLQETVRVPVNGNHVQSITQLGAGGDYVLEASGYFELSPNTDPGGAKHADAEYGIFKPVPYDVKPTYWNVNYGIAVKDLGQQNPHDLGLYWGSLASDTGHTYRVGYTGGGGKLDLWYRDDLYADNEVIPDGDGGNKPYEMLVNVYRLLSQAPDHLTAMPDPKHDRVTLAWRDNTAGEQWFEIQRKVDGDANWTTLTEKAPADATTYIDTSVQSNPAHRYTYRVRAHTATDDSPYSNEAVTVLMGNSLPSIETIPTQSAIEHRRFAYRVQAVDPDQPWVKPSYSLQGAPDGMTINSAGYINWIDPVAGIYPNIVVSATNASDPTFTTDTGSTSFTVTVAPLGANRPTIDSATAVLSSQSPNVVKLDASATQNNSPAGLTYTWSVLIAPEGAKSPVFSAANGTGDGGHITATFGPDGAIGQYVFLLTVSDAAGHVETATPGVTVSPVMTTLRIAPRNQTVPQDVDYPFRAIVKDQFGDPITSPQLSWKIDGGADLTETDASVLVQTGTSSGAHRLSVEDASQQEPPIRLSDSVVFTVAAAANRWPVIGTVAARPDPNNPQPPPGDPYKVWLTADATDDNPPPAGLIYTWTKVSGPGNVTFDSNNGTSSGNRVSATYTVPGSYVFSVKVRDRGDPQNQAPSVTVPFNDQPVLTTLDIDVNPPGINIAPGSADRTLTVRGLNQFGGNYDISSEQIGWTLNGAVLTGSGTQRTWSPPSTEGDFVFAASVNGAVGTLALKTVAPQKPIVAIVSPAQATRTTLSAGGLDVTPKAPVLDPTPIVKDTDVFIRVDDPNDDLNWWTLVARPADGGAPIRLAGDTVEKGVSAVVGERVAIVRPLMLPQGLYTLELTANDVAGDEGATQATRQIVIKPELKLGNLALPMTDLTVQGRGLPITISRTYDSLRANKYDSIEQDQAGDFGPGWRLDSYDLDMQVSAPSRPGNTHTAPGYHSFYPGDTVQFTLPGGRVEAFVFDPQPGGTINGIDFHLSFSPAFRPLSGTESRLAVVNAAGADPGPTLIVNPATGEFFDHLTNKGYDPAYTPFGGHYQLTTKDGTQYVINAATGKLENVTDTNRNRVEYAVDLNGRLMSIKSYNTQAPAAMTTVTVNRRTDGRISSIVDDIGTSTNNAAGHQVIYAYEDNFTNPSEPTVPHPGQLKSVEDRAGNITRYAYGAQDPLRYHLTKVTDPRGLVVLEATYDSATRELTALNDPYKKTAPFGDTVASSSGARKSVTDLAGNKTEFVYDLRGRPLREISEIKSGGKLTGYRVTFRAYDDWEDGSPMTVKQYEPFTIDLATQEAGQRYTFIPSVVASTTQYDNDGNLKSQTDALGRSGTMEDYTPLGKPRTVKDAYGHATTLDYDMTGAGEGNLLSSTNAAGETTKYAYGDGRGNVTEVSERRNNDDYVTARYQYDGPDGRMNQSQSNFEKVGAVFVPMQQRDYAYATASIAGQNYRQETVALKWRDVSTDADFTHTLTESVTVFDAEDRPWKVTDANGKTTETQYNSLGKVAKTIDPFGGVTAYDYDARGNLIRTLYPDKTEARTAYDGMGRVEWQTDRYAANSNPAANNFIDNSTLAPLATFSVYDEAGRVVESRRYRDLLIKVEPDTDVSANTTILRAVATDGVLLSTSKTAFDPAGRASSQTDAAGLRTETTYYDDGRVRNVRPVVTNADGSASAGTGYEYDFQDLQGEWHRQDRVTDALGHTTTTDYDELGRAVRVTYADGSFAETLYGDNGQPASGVALPTASEGWPTSLGGGRHEVKIAQRKAGEAAVATHYLYGLQGGLTDVWQPPVRDADPLSPTYSPDEDDPVRPHWHYDYDGLGNLTKITDPTGDFTTFAYDDQGRRISRTLPAINGNTVTETTTYDSFGRVLTQKDFKGQTTAYTYEDSPAGQGRLMAEYRYNGGVAALDANNAVITASAAERTEYGYDSLGRRSSVREYTGTSLTRTTTYNYDPVTGGTSKIESPEGTINYVYDAATGRLTETWTSTNAASPTTRTLYGYDVQGRLASVASAKVNGVAPAAPQVQRTRFNAVGQVVAGNTLPTTTYEYDPAGNLDKVNLPNGLVEDYDYDELNRLDKETITRVDGTAEQEFDYTLLSNGQRDHVLERRIQADGVTEFSRTRITWAYDDLGRLKGETRDVGDNGQDGDDYVATYSFDLSGNRQQKVFNSADNTKDETIDYTYDARDRLLSEDSTVNAHDADYTYDDNGSTLTMTKTGVVTRYAWDQRNRLAGVDANNDGDLNDGGDTKYAYDTDGVRVSKTTGGATTNYLSDPANPTGYSKVLEEKDAAGNVAVTYVLGLAVLGQAKSADLYVLKYLVRDGHGTARLFTSASGAVVQRYDFDAFLSPLSADALAAQTAYAAPDGMSDSETGFTYSLARYRRGFVFVSQDPASGGTSDPLTLHKYVYANGNPVVNVDPSGRMSDGEALVVSGLIALMATLTLHKIYSDASNATAAYMEHKYMLGTQYLEQELMGLFSLSFRGPSIRTPQLQAVNATIQVSAVNTATAESLAAQYLTVFSGIESFNGHNYVRRPGADERDVSDSQGNPVRIVGQSGSTSGTPGHDAAIDAIAEQQLKQRGTLMIFLQRSLRTATGRTVPLRDIPDVIVIRFNQAGNITKGIKIDLYEVQSANQTRRELEEKLTRIMSEIPKAMQGEFKVIDP